MPPESELQRLITKPANPNPPTVRIQVEPARCAVRRPTKKTRQIVRRSLTSPSIEYSQGPDGAFQVTPQHSIWTWEADDHLYFARGHLSRVTPELREAGYDVRLNSVVPNELQFAALRSLRNRSFRTLGEHIERFTSRLTGVHQWPRPKVDHEGPRVLSANHLWSLQQVGVNEDSPLGKQALWTIAATPLGQLIFQNERRRLAALVHLFSILPPTQTCVLCRNDQDVQDLVRQIRQIEGQHSNRYQIPWGGIASRNRGSVHIMPVSGIHKIPVDRQHITPRYPETSHGVVLPRLLIFWGAELACHERVLKLCDNLSLDNTSRFLFSMSRRPGHMFDEMVLQQMCGSVVWHEIHGWFLPKLKAGKCGRFD